MEQLNEFDIEEVCELEVDIEQVGPRGLSAYEVYLQTGGTLSEEEWLESLKGITPTIGANGNWFLGDIDTGLSSRGEKGETGGISHEELKVITGELENLSTEDKTSLVNAINELASSGTSSNAILVHDDRINVTGNLISIGTDARTEISKLLNKNIDKVVLICIYNSSKKLSLYYLLKVDIPTKTATISHDIQGLAVYGTSLYDCNGIMFVGTDATTITGVGFGNIYINQYASKTDLDTATGDLNTLLTEDKSNLVNAINESVANAENNKSLGDFPCYYLYNSDKDLKMCKANADTSVTLEDTTLTRLLEIVNETYSKGLEGFHITLRTTESVWNNYYLFKMCQYNLQDKPKSLRLLTDIYVQNTSDFLHTSMTVSLTWSGNVVTEVSAYVRTSVINIAMQNSYLSKTNTTEYIPTSDYHPVTKLYVDTATGDLTTLVTEDKSNLVNAINEVINNNISSSAIVSDSNMNITQNSLSIGSDTRIKIKDVINKNLDNGVLICVHNPTLKISLYFMTWIAKPTNSVTSQGNVFGLVTNYSEVYSWSARMNVGKNGTTGLITSVSFSDSTVKQYSTREYVDGLVGDISTVLATLTTVSEVSE